MEAKVQEAVAGVLSDETLNLTAKLLKLNPEYYTIWNHRRRILEALFAGKDTASVEGLITTDLQFLLPLLLQYPKCYWIWNHRLWLLQRTSALLPPTTAQTFWTQELGLVGKMLGRDSRNFHGWGYRRIVVDALRGFSINDQNSSASLTESEFAYTTKMVKGNLSNFSAWHNRSKLIPLLLEERGANEDDRRRLFDAELALIQSALFTDPYDQSLWFYHEFLMITLLSTAATGPTRSFAQFTNHDREEYLATELAQVRELLEDTDDCKWIYQFLLHYSAKYLDLDAGNKAFSTLDLRQWLDQLNRLDPLRKARWKDLEKSLGM